MKKKKPDPLGDIAGIILANRWDENGNVIGVSLYTDREENYNIAQNKKILELINLVRTKVWVQGKVEEGANGKKSIYVEEVRTEKKENE